MSQLLAEMGMGGRSQQNRSGDKGHRRKVTRKGNQALEVLWGQQSRGQIQVTNSAVPPPTKAGWPPQAREPGSGRHSPT